MTLRRVSPEEALDLMEKEGYVYLDVRSIPEFDQGHPTGAYNVPLLHMTPGGMDSNPDFLDVVKKTFPPDQKIVVGCKAGGRSLRAAQQLEQAGYTQVVDQRAGFVGAADQFGRLAEPGWQPKNLPTSTAPEIGHSYEELAKKAGKA